MSLKKQHSSKGDKNHKKDGSPEFESKDLKVGTKNSQKNRRRKKRKKSEGDHHPKRLSNKFIEDQLTHIYENEDGSLPDMTHIQRKNSWGILIKSFLVIVILGFFATLAWIGFLIFEPQGKFSQDDVVLSIDGIKNVSIGEEVQYRIKYRNVQGGPLDHVSIEIRYPDGFEFVTSSIRAENEQNSKWDLGGVAEFSGGYIDITGRVYGDIGDKQSLRVFMNYLPENFSSEFQKVTSLTIELGEGAVALALTGPESIQPGGEVELTLVAELDEDAEFDVDNFAFVLEPFSEFTIKDSDPIENDGEDGIWSIKELGTAPKEIIISGSFNTGITDLPTLTAKLVGWKDGERMSDAHVFGMTTYAPKEIVVNDTQLQLAINGAVAEDDLAPGDLLSTTISIKNNSENSIKDAKVRIIFETPSYNNKSFLNWGNLVDIADGNIEGDQLSPDRRKGIITWSVQQISGLSEIKAGETIDIDLSMPFKTSDDIDLTQFPDGVVTVVAELQYGEGTVISSNEIEITVVSDVKLKIEDDISTTSDGKDKHTVKWVLTNTFHDLSAIELKVDIYGDVIWQEEELSVPAGEVTFDEDTGKLVWKIDTMPTSLDVLALQFSVILNSENPSQTNLTSKVTGKATDDAISQDIILVGEEILLGSE